MFQLIASLAIVHTLHTPALQAEMDAPRSAERLEFRASYLAPEEPTELEYSQWAQAFLDAHEIQNAVPGNVVLQELLDTEHYQRFDLGLFDLRISANSLEDRKLAKLFAESALALLQMQASWVKWSASEHPEYEQILDQFDVLVKWVKGWSATSLSALARAEDTQFLDRLGAKEPVLEAHAAVSKFMTTGKYLGLSLSESSQAQILFAPNRTEFIQLVCFTGWAKPDVRPSFWKQGVEQWTSFWNDSTQIIAMDYPAYPIDMKRPERGAPMDEFEKEGLGQHSVEKAAAAMFWHYYGSNDALFFEAALATNLVIDVFGENNVRTGAPVFKSSGGSSSPYEVFVPGGNSAGGVLPARGAISIIDIPIWRETKGKDHYVKPLQKAQKLGLKLARKAKHPSRDKRDHFIIEGQVAGEKSFVTAPFFGTHAKTKPLPEKTYLVDYEEFFRAYRASFFDWLKQRGAGKDKKRNAELFGQLLSRLSTRTAQSTFADIVEELYGAPLSAADGEQDSLEWRFLTYVSKGGR